MGKCVRFTFQGRAQGGTKVEAIGFKGHGCEAAVQELAKAMGGSVGNVTHTNDYFKQEKDLTAREKELE